jgi:hypothetical protein
MTQFTIWDPAIGERKANLALTNNFAATTNPSVSNDTTQGYQAGSVWINTSTKAIFECVSNAAGAAVWVELAAAGGEVPDVSSAYNAASSAVSFTATGAQISGGSAIVVLDLTGNPAGAANVTLPTVAALVAALTNPIAGDSYNLRIKNSANSGTWTVVTNTGWTLTGTMTIATTVYRDFVLTLNSLSAATLQNVGGGTA